MSSGSAASAFLKSSSSTGAAAGTVVASPEHGDHTSTVISTYLAPFEDEITNACFDMPFSDSAAQGPQVMLSGKAPFPVFSGDTNKLDAADESSDGWIAWLGLETASQTIAEFTDRYLTCSLQGKAKLTKHVRQCASSFADLGQAASSSFHGQQAKQ